MGNASYKSKFKRKSKSKSKSKFKFKSLRKRWRRGTRVFKRDSMASHSSSAGRCKGLLTRINSHENHFLMVKHVVDGTVCCSVISDINNSIKLVQDDNLRATLSLLTDGNFNPISGCSDYCVVASCNRWMLVICQKIPSERYEFLWNPTTDERVRLRDSSSNISPVGLSSETVRLWAHGVGFDPASGDCKVVRYCVYDDPHECVFAAVMSVTTGVSRTITYPHDSSIYLCGGSSIYINGFFYWIALGPLGDGVVVSFDFAKEEFGRALIRLPKSDKKQGKRTSFCIADYHGSLALIIYDFKRVSGEMEKPFSFEIWVWDATGCSWSCSSTVDIPAAQVAVAAPLLRVLGLYENDNLLAENTQGDLLIYNLPTQTLVDLGIHHDDKGPGKIGLFPFVGSSIPIINMTIN